MMIKIKILSLFLLLFLTGCGPRLTMVSGTVQWKNEPVKDGVIEFVPLDDKTLPATPLEVVNGKYAGTVHRGRMQVQISSFVKTGSYFPSGKGGPEINVTKNVVPEEYNLKSTLEIVVTGGKQTYDFP